MLQMTEILILLAFLLAGAFVAGFQRAPKPRIVDIAMSVSLWILLFSMGFRIGNNPELVQSIGTIGFMGLISAVFTIAGSCVAVWLTSLLLPSFNTLYRKRAKPLFEEAEGINRASNALPFVFARLKFPARLLVIIVAGFMVGFLAPKSKVNPSLVTDWMLNVLLFMIGMQFRQSGIQLAQALKSPAVIALPLATAVGSILGGIALAPIFSLTLAHGMALASGFGWYSLSGVLISDLGNPLLGSSAFLANMLRESLGLILIPLLGQTKIPYMAISVAGATSMDVSLPLIEQTLGPEAVPVSFVSGAVLSMIVPVIVPLLMRA